MEVGAFFIVERYPQYTASLYHHHSGRYILVIFLIFF